MVAMTDIQRRRSEILRLAEQHGARNVRVFGSWPVVKAGRRATWTCSSRWTRTVR